MPGVAAELAGWAARLPLGAVAGGGGDAVWWECTVEVPPIADPHFPECVMRLVTLFDSELPALAARLTGRALAPAQPGRVGVRVWRKGSFADATPAGVPPEGIEAVVGLTGARWPEEWGGALEVLDGAGVAVERRPPAWNSLDLAGGATPRRITLVTRHVEVLTLHSALVPGAT